MSNRGKKILHFLFFSTICVLTGLSGISRGFISHIIHSHHHFSEHSHFVDHATEFADAKWHDSGSHLKFAHAGEHEGKGRAAFDLNALDSDAPLPRPKKVSLQFPLYVHNQQINTDTEYRLEPDLIRRLPQYAVEIYLSETKSSQAFTTFGMPPPNSQVVRILLSNHALLI